MFSYPHKTKIFLFSLGYVFLLFCNDVCCNVRKKNSIDQGSKMNLFYFLDSINKFLYSVYDSNIKFNLSMSVPNALQLTIETDLQVRQKIDNPTPVRTRQ